MDGGVAGLGAGGLEGVAHGGPVVQRAGGGETTAGVDAGAEDERGVAGRRADNEGHLKCRFVAEGVGDLHGEGEGAGLQRNPDDAAICAQLEALRQCS